MKSKKIPGLKELFEKKLIKNPLAACAFIQQEFDKRQYWLEFWSGTYRYKTSINLSKWKKFNLKTRNDIIKYSNNRLWKRNP